MIDTTRAASRGHRALGLALLSAAAGLAIGPVMASARATDAAPAKGKPAAPQSILPDEAATPAPAKSAAPAAGAPLGTAIPGGPATAVGTPPTAAPAAPVATPAAAAVDADATPAPANAAPVAVTETVMPWSVADAKALLGLINGIGSEGLISADYKPQALKDAIAAGPGDALDALASRSFSWLIEDLRDGRTPMDARVQWFAVDPDQDATPTAAVMAKALSDHDVGEVVAALDPTHPDFAALREKLAATPKADTATRDLIRVNMDRWRWLPRDLGKAYMFSNVPEYMVRLTVHKASGTYWNWTSKTVVGKPGRTATPQMAETIKAVVFNPTWTVPQSIVKGEGLGAKVLANPGWAKANGYKGWKSDSGMITVVQQPGPNNALGLMKIDMPNPHAIYFHDTPSKANFNADVRAFSHGCVRTQDAVQLGMMIAMLGADMDTQTARDLHNSGKYNKVDLTKTFPVYITYFTMASAVDPETKQFGPIRKFGDVYGRDKPVLASFAAARQVKTTQRASDEEVIQLDNPL